jgi:hypothetical protein
LETGKLPGKLEELVLSAKDLRDFSSFAELFEVIFGFPISSDTPFIRRLPDIEKTNQALLNLQDASSDPVDHVRALHTFACQFFAGMIRVDNGDFNETSLLDVIGMSDRGDYEREHLERLILLNQYAEKHNRKQVDFNARTEIFNKIRLLIASDLRNYLTQHDAEIPKELDQFLRESNRPVRDQVFISYSHDDSEEFNVLSEHLKPLQRYKGLNVWSDEKIEVGQIWRAEIDKALSVAKVAILLVTRKFLASDFISSEELPEILRTADSDGLTIIWVAVGASNVEHTPIFDYQCANDPKTPIRSLLDSRKDAVWVEICSKIDKAMEK